MSAYPRTLLVGAATKATFPPVCALCLAPAEAESNEIIAGAHVPYCAACHAKVQRLQGWCDGRFMISLIPGVIGAIIALIGVVVSEDQGWIELLRVDTWLIIGATGLVVMGIAWVVLWLAMLPLRLILRHKLARPGVRIVKSKQSEWLRLRFVNREYARLFCQTNDIDPTNRR